MLYLLLTCPVTRAAHLQVTPVVGTQSCEGFCEDLSLEKGLQSSL